MINWRDSVKIMIYLKFFISFLNIIAFMCFCFNGCAGTEFEYWFTKLGDYKDEWKLRK